MKKIFTARKYVPAALALAAFAAVFVAQSASAQGGSAAPQTYNPADDSVDNVNAHAPWTNSSGHASFAQAPATIHQGATQSHGHVTR